MSMLPRFIEPMRAVSGSDAFNDANYLFELKYNGIRASFYCRDGESSIIDGSHKDIGECFPSLLRAGKSVKRNIALDGEIVAIDTSTDKQNLGAVMRCKSHKTTVPGFEVVFFAFDVMHRNKKSLYNMPLLQRKEELYQLTKNLDAIRPVDFITYDGIDLFNASKRTNCTGVVAKLKTSRYEPGIRSESWKKIERHPINEGIKRHDLVVVGATKPNGTKRGLPFGSFILGYFENGKIYPVCKTTGGLTNEHQEFLNGQLQKVLINSPQCILTPNVNLRGKEVMWFKPTLVCEVQAMGKYPNGNLYEPIFLRFRDDKQVADCPKP